MYISSRAPPWVIAAPPGGEIWNYCFAYYFLWREFQNAFFPFILHAAPLVADFGIKFGELIMCFGCWSMVAPPSHFHVVFFRDVLAGYFWRVNFIR
jgi:hypothetical protein